MLTQFVLALAATLTSLGVTALPQKRNSLEFSVPLAPNPNFKPDLLSVARAYIKYGIPLPKELYVGGLNGSVSNKPQKYDRAYLADIDFMGQVLPIDFDTGSSDLWIFSNKMPFDERETHKFFNVNKAGSNFTLLQGYTWNITYGDGSTAYGLVGTGPVTIAGITVQNQTVEIATHASGSFTSNYPSSGLHGLAFSGLNQVSPTQQKTWFDNIRSSLTLPLFTANLESKGAGSYNFGFIDDSLYTGNIQYASVVERYFQGVKKFGFWEFNTTSYDFGTKKYPLTNSSAIIDTGTSIILLGNNVAKKYWSNVSSAVYSEYYGLWKFNCTQTPPNFTVNWGESYSITVPGKSITYVNLGSDTCLGAITGIPAKEGLTVLGDTFLRNAFVVFEQDGDKNPRVGIAAKKV